MIKEIVAKIIPWVIIGLCTGLITHSKDLDKAKLEIEFLKETMNELKSDIKEIKGDVKEMLRGQK